MPIQIEPMDPVLEPCADSNTTDLDVEPCVPIRIEPMDPNMEPCADSYVYSTQYIQIRNLDTRFRVRTGQKPSVLLFNILYICNTQSFHAICIFCYCTWRCVVCILWGDQLVAWHWWVISDKLLVC